MNNYFKKKKKIHNSTSITYIKHLSCITVTLLNIIIFIIICPNWSFLKSSSLPSSNTFFRSPDCSLSLSLDKSDPATPWLSFHLAHSSVLISFVWIYTFNFPVMQFSAYYYSQFNHSPLVLFCFFFNHIFSILRCISVAFLSS